MAGRYTPIEDHCASPLVKLYIVVLILSHCSTSASADGVRSKNYVRLTTPGVTIQAASSSTKASVISCSAACMVTEQHSYFMYNKDARQCSCGSSLVAGSVDASYTLYRDEDAAADIFCPSSVCISYAGDGFSCISLKESAICVKKVSWSELYADAETACAAYPSGRLFIPDTSEKLTAVSQQGWVTGWPLVWVGMDERATEGTWVWADGKVMTADEQVLWASGEPNNQDCNDGGNDDCGAALNYGLFDVCCSTWNGYICEIPLV